MKTPLPALTAALALCLVTGSVEAQATTFGLSAGATYSDFAGGAVNTDSRWGAIAGVSAAYRNWDNAVTQLEVNWVQKGGGDVRLDYIEIPLLIGGLVEYPNGTGARLYSGIGVSFSVGCSAEPAVVCDADRRTEWTWPIGLQLGRWATGGRVVALDVRYSWAFTDTFEGSIGENRSWQFKLVFGQQR